MLKLNLGSYMASALTKILCTLGTTLLPIGLTSCDDVSTNSVDIGTSSIRAEITFTATGNGSTDVEAYLREGSTYLELIDLDDFYAIANDQSLDLEEDRDSNNNYVYRNRFNFDEGGTYFGVTLSRAFEDDARHSDVDLPEPANFVTPSEGEMFDVDDAISISWQPSGFSELIEFHHQVVCDTNLNAIPLEEVTAFITDTGLYDSTITELLGNALTNVADGVDCHITFRLTRMEEGDLDNSFGSGFIRAIQIRTRTITINR